MRIRRLLVLCFSIGVLTLSTESQAKQEALGNFLSAYNQTKLVSATKSSEIVKNLQWFLPQSPWFQYLRKQFEEGLTHSDYKQYLSAQNRYACKEVADLDRIGFINLYPHLSKAFDNADIQKTFELVISNTSNGYNRCVILKRINSHMTDAKDKEISIGPHDLGIKDAQKADPLKLRPDSAYSFIYNDYIQHELAALVKLAFCHAYPRALSDLLQFTKSPYLLELTPTQTFRLIAQAQAVGVPTIEFDSDFEILNKRLSPGLKARVYTQIKQNMTAVEATTVPILNKECRRNGFLRHYAFLN